MTPGDIKDFAIVVGVFVGAGSLVFAALNLMITARTNRAKFWLELRSAFATHDEVHRKLRPGGEWASGEGPTTSDEYAQIEAYMSLFGYCEIMLSQKIIDEETFREIYEYRLKNLIANDWVRIEKVCRRGELWPRFIAVLERMDIKYTC